MDDSILYTIKKMLGLSADYTPFDTDIVVHINSVLMILKQLGVGPSSGFSITGPDEKWSDYLEDSAKLEAVKSYIYLKVRSVWDSGINSTLSDAIEKQIAEYEWRLNVEAETGGERS